MRHVYGPVRQETWTGGSKGSQAERDSESSRKPNSRKALMCTSLSRTHMWFALIFLKSLVVAAPGWRNQCVCVCVCVRERDRERKCS